MAKYKTGQPIVCPQCKQQAIFEEMADGYATKRWQGNREELPYVRCPLCTCTFPLWGIESYAART